jgi:hypothetical protein
LEPGDEVLHALVGAPGGAYDSDSTNVCSVSRSSPRPTNPKVNVRWSPRMMPSFGSPPLKFGPLRPATSKYPYCPGVLVSLESNGRSSRRRC